MKRFTETAKWDDPWFRSLPGVQKLVFLYVLDRCNNAGFWEVDEEMIVVHTKVDPKHIEGAWKGLARGIKSEGGWVWVRRFLRHQKAEDLNPENPAHRHIIPLIREQVQRFSVIPEFIDFLAPFKGLISPTVVVEEAVEGKGVRKKSAEKKGVLPDVPNDLMLVEEFESGWMKFIQHRKEIKKPLTPLAAHGILSSLSERPTDAVPALKMAIRRSWQGIEWDWFDKERGGTKTNGHKPGHINPNATFDEATNSKM